MLLGGILCQNFVEFEVLFVAVRYIDPTHTPILRGSSLILRYLVFCIIDFEHFLFVAGLFFVVEHWADSNRHSNVRRHLTI